MDPALRLKLSTCDSVAPVFVKHDSITSNTHSKKIIETVSIPLSDNLESVTDYEKNRSAAVSRTNERLKPKV